jgi:hypothetical protein
MGMRSAPGQKRRSQGRESGCGSVQPARWPLSSWLVSVPFLLPPLPMTLHQPRRPPHNPFLNHALLGWDPEGAATRFPVCFSVHAEGRNIGLYLTPADVPFLRDALDLPDDDHALVLRGGAAFNVPWAMIGLLGGDLEVVHRARDACADPEASPGALLADPARAVPPGSRVALSLQDGCHAAIFTPEIELLRRCMSAFLEDYQATVMGRDIEVPTLAPELLTALLEPRPVGTWTRIQLEPRQRYWVLELEHGGADGGVVTERWVSEGEGGRWRTGWAC